MGSSGTALNRRRVWISQAASAGTQAPARSGDVCSSGCVDLRRASAAAGACRLTLLVCVILDVILAARIDEVVLLETFLGGELLVALRLVAKIIFVGWRVFDALEQIVRQIGLVVLVEHASRSGHVS